MKRFKIYAINIPLLLILLLIATGCPRNSGTNDSSGTTSSAGTTFTTTIDKDKSDKVIKSNAFNPLKLSCPPGSMGLFSQHIMGNASINLVAQGPTQDLPTGIMDIIITVTDGKYTTKMQALNADCYKTGPSADVTINFSLTHHSHVDAQNQPFTCVWKSGVTFQSFSYTGIQVIDEFILNVVKDDILKEMDFTVGDYMNRFEHNNQGLPSGAEPRCPDWQSF